MMAQRPLVSVIVPVYNASDYLAATLRSFEGQSYGNVEWVLVDDGSTDGSAQVCAEWCAADPLHRRLFRKQNGGASSARNTGLEHAVGAYVLFWAVTTPNPPWLSRSLLNALMGSIVYRFAPYEECCPMEGNATYLLAGDTSRHRKRPSMNG